MKGRYIAILSAIIVFGTISANCGDYEMIGKGGPNSIKIDMDQHNQTIDSRYMMIDGLPDTEYFSIDLIPEENQSEIMNYVRTETLKGHIYDFQGQLKVGDCEFKGPLKVGEYTYCIRRFDESKIIVEDLHNVSCTQNYREPLKCSISMGYLVDYDGNLHLVKGLTVIPDANREGWPGWQYHGYGYLVRVQRLKNVSNNVSKESLIPDPGGYDIKWSNYWPRSTSSCIPADLETFEEYVDFDVTVEKSYNRDESVPDEKAVYEISVVYTGMGSLSNVTLTDIIPAGFSYINGTSQISDGTDYTAFPPTGQTDENLNWTIDTLESGINKNVWVKVAFSISQGADTRANRAYASWVENGTIQKSRTVMVSI